ncbi:hypothetical protein HMPREF0004_0137 [Achromobacter piechaudii ATCC 43553]|uniref:Uncharacterized protein n=1 Tax=Achromobacter piechaudii ATCC 43553 TaxID=742159 RepID=D4X3U0_9BURK|nr:hypothetical protein HMPREF0004_0137 [Achromobacter piechaudii ATCC 43553]
MRSYVEQARLVAAFSGSEAGNRGRGHCEDGAHTVVLPGYAPACLLPVLRRFGLCFF